MGPIMTSSDITPCTEAAGKLSLAQRIDLLRRVPILECVDRGSLAGLAAQMQEITVEQGDYVFRQGDIGECAYVVVEGEVAIIAGERKIAALASGDCFGEMSLVDGLPRSASAIATTQVHALTMTEHALFDHIRRDTAVARGIFRMLSGRLREMLHRSDGAPH